MEWLRAAMVFTALSSAVVAITFFHVWRRHVRQPHVRLWGSAWALAVPYLALSVVALDLPPNPYLTGLLQLLPMANALLVAAGCFHLVHGRAPRWSRLLLLATPLACWALVTPHLTDHWFLLALPTSVLLGGSYLWTSALFLRVHAQRGMQGARTLGVLFGTAGLHELDYPIFANVPSFAPVGYALSAILAFGIALFLLVLILEESRSAAERDHALLRTIVDALSVGVVVTSRDGSVVISNDEARRLSGLQGTDEGVPRPFPPALCLPDGDACAPEAMPSAVALRTGKPVPATELALRTGGTALQPLLVRASPLRDQHGELQGVVSVLEDIAPLKRAQVEAARAEKLRSLGMLAAGVAHDFNNALMMILGHAQLAQDLDASPALRRELDVIETVAVDSAAIVRRIQDMARVRVGTDHESVVDLAAVVRDVLEICRPRWKTEAQAAGVSFDIKTELAPDASVRGNAGEVREALVNLVLNALDAMPKGGQLCLRVSTDGAQARLEVADSGTGMSPDVAERIFEPYFTTKGLRGTGLGLPLVYGILHRHRAKIDVASEVGNGTTFTITFPRHEATPVAADAPLPSAPVPRLRVLVVDDEPLIAGILETMLRRDGHDVTATTSGSRAIDLVSRTEFDIVMTDMGMAGVNGWEVARNVARLRPTTRVVLVTGWGETVDPVAASSAGVAAVLGKPFTRDRILACVRDLALASAA